MHGIGKDGSRCAVISESMWKAGATILKPCDMSRNRRLHFLDFPQYPWDSLQYFCLIYLSTKSDNLTQSLGIR